MGIGIHDRHSFVELALCPVASIEQCRVGVVPCVAAA
jgi:hypothetical protein